MTETDPAARFIPAIPPVAVSTNAEAKPLPGRKPDDPRLEAAFRTILRQGTAPEEVDAKLVECRDHVKGNAGLTEQLRSAAVLGVYLIEESAAGRLKVRYGSPHVLNRLKALLDGFGNSEAPNRGQPRRDQPERRPQSASPNASRQAEVWLCVGERIADLLRPEAEWPFVKQHLSGLKLYVDQINKAAPEQLAALVRLVKEQRYQVAVELGGCLDFAPMDDTAGEWSARHELAKIEKLHAAGGQVDFLDVDGPIRRLMHPENRPDGRRFESVEKAADELVDALRLHRQANPKTQFWLLSNFPNWGWRGDVSYHARGPKRQDYGDDDEVVRVVLRKLQAAGLALEGMTMDNPYDYLIGEHRSVNLKDPKSVDWLGRVRAYEDFAREQGLAFNLIVNSERGGHESDERFCRETLQMVDLYRQAGGQPTRWFVQSWYPHPKQIVPETAPHTMTALLKAVIEGVRPGEAAPTRRQAPPDALAAPEPAAELAKFDRPQEHLPRSGPGGTEWDAHYRSFIQTDDSATSKGLPSHAEAAKQIKADAAKSAEALQKHKGWILYIKHFSQAYRPEPATADLKRLYEDLVTMQFGGATRKETLPFDGDARLTIHRNVVFGNTAPEIHRLDAYLVKSDRPTPVLIEFHGGGWRRGAKSQFTYSAGLIEAILAAGISVISVDYRLTPKHPFPAQVEDAARAVQFVRSKAKEWNLDPERIVAMGGSAGAHLSAWVALHDDLARADSPDPIERQSTRLRGFVDLWGPMDLMRVRPTELAQAGLRGADFADAFTAAFACTAEAFEQDPVVRRRVRAASPLFLVTRDDPPGLILHAAGEEMAPGKHPPVPEIINDPHSAWHGLLLAEAMRKAGIEIVCRIGPQVGKVLAADNAAILRFILHGPQRGLDPGEPGAARQPDPQRAYPPKTP